MKTFTIIILCFVWMHCSAQDELLTLSSNKWRQGQTKTLYGHEIKKVESNGYGYTNICFRDSSNLLQKVKEDAEKEMWSAVKKNKEIENILTAWAGGIISLYIARSTIGAANTQYFTIIVHDQSGNELHREELDEGIPNVPGRTGLWWNIGSVFLSRVHALPLNVYVIDGLDTNHPKHHFIIQN